MIFSQTFLHVFDNSGVIKVKCIKIHKSKTAKIGSLLTCVIVQIKPYNFDSKIKKGDFVKGLVIQTKKNQIHNVYNNGIFIKSFEHNSVILFKHVQNIKNNFFFIGSRVLCGISFIIGQKGFLKLFYMANKCF